MPEKLDFITPTLMRVLELFLADPMQEHHEREVIRITHVSKGSANHVLRMLSRLNFLIRRKRGRMVFYMLDTRQLAVRQFKVLVNVYALKKLLEGIREHCRRVVLFGSCAQGTDVKESDIDLFVLTSEKNLVRRKISEFNRINKRKIAPIIVDANEFVKLKREDRPLYENIDRGLVLWEKE